MIVDRKNKLIILGNRKCASSSLYNKFLKRSDVISPFEGKPSGYVKASAFGKEIKLSPKHTKLFTQHFKHFNYVQEKYFLDIFGEDISTFNTLVAIRNPFDRCLSEYKYWLRNADTGIELERRRSIGLNNYLLSLPRLHENGLYSFIGAGNIEKVKVLKVESLNQQLQEVFSELQLSQYSEILKSSELSKINNTNEINLDPSELEFNPEIKDIIKNIFWLDFRCGGYSLSDY